MKLIDLIESCADRLQQAGVAFGHGTTNAFDEAAWLVLWKLGLPLDGLDGHEQDEVDAARREQAQALVEQRIASRRPAAYLTGEAWLQGVPFYVDERAIVPRSFIAELLADGTIDPWLNPEPPTAAPCPPGGRDQLEAARRRPQSPRVLDLCTGNGSLAVLAALAWPEIQVDAADLSQDALAVAAINVQQHHLQHRIRLLQSDGLGSLPGPYDLIVCNPPYVNSSSMAQLPPEFRAEPELALAGGADGMDFVRALLKDAPLRMSEPAVLVLEIGNERGHFEAAFPRLEAVWLETSAGADQVLLLTREALVRQ